jgi:uncharacterized membrane protein YoaK (UPF0700 family)
MSNIDQTHVSWLLPFVLSATGGAVDVIGFLALGGLFTVHITGNIMILAASGITGMVATLLVRKRSFSLAQQLVLRPGETGRSSGSRRQTRTDLTSADPTSK